MSALEFPASPSDGDTYAGYVFNAAKNVWQWVTTSIDAVSPQYGDILAYDPTGTRFTNALDVNGVMVFDDSAARGSAIPSPTEGMVTYRKDEKTVEVFDGSAFGPIGKILQVVSTTKTNVFVQSVAGRTESNNIMTASITPTSTSSKVLVLVSLSASAANQSNVGVVLNKNNAASGFRGDGLGSRKRLATTVHAGSISPFGSSSANIMFLDSPNSVSAQTYQLRLYNTSNGAQNLFLNRSADDSDNDSIPRSASSITLMEVAG